MSNVVKFKINGLYSALSHIYTRVTDLSRVELFEGETLASDAVGNVELDIGSAGSIGQSVIIYGDNYSIGNESTFKSFSGYGLVEEYVAPVEPANGPTFTSQPQSQTVDDSGAATFTTAVDNADGYQWYKNGVAAGQQSQPYTASGMKAIDNGSVIWCKAWNDGGVTYSNLATLTAKSYRYNLDGSTMYGQLTTPIKIEDYQDFEYIFDIEVKSASDKKFAGATTSTRSGLFGWDAAGTFVVRAAGTWRVSTETVLQTIGDHVIKLKRVSGAYYFKADAGSWTRISTFTSASPQYLDFIGRAYGTSSSFYASDCINRTRVYIGGDATTGALSLDVRFNDKSLGANPVSTAGSKVTIVNHDAARWEDATLPALPSITAQPVQPSALTESQLVSLSVAANSAASFTWFKNHSIIATGSAFDFYAESGDDDAEIFCIACGDNGYTYSDSVMLSVTALSDITTAGYSFESLTSSGNTITSWADYANSNNIVSISGVDGFTLNGKGALTVGRGGFVNLPASLNSLFAVNNTIIIACALTDMTAPSTIFKAVGTNGAVEIIAYPNIAKITFKHGSTSYDINVELDQDVHLFTIERNGTVLNGYYDELSVVGVASSVTGVSASILCGDFDGLLAEAAVFNTNLTDAYKRKFGVL